jgi:hypothetical protein
VANPLLRDGPIPVALHGAIEYLAGVLFIAAPLVFEFRSGVATGVSVACGIIILLVAATTSGPTSLVDGLAVSVHAVLDYVLAVILIVAPFLLGFSDETNPTAFFIALGIAHLLITIGTRFSPQSKA